MAFKSINMTSNSVAQCQVTPRIHTEDFAQNLQIRNNSYSTKEEEPLQKHLSFLNHRIQTRIIMASRFLKRRLPGQIPTKQDLTILVVKVPSAHGLQNTEF